MKFDELAQSIKEGKNLYEAERGIETVKVVPWQKISEQVYLFLGFKDEKRCITATIFIAFKKGKTMDRWEWMCPDRETCRNLGKEIENRYNFVNRVNEQVRRGEGVIDMENPLRVVKKV